MSSNCFLEEHNKNKAKQKKSTDVQAKQPSFNILDQINDEAVDIENIQNQNEKLVNQFKIEENKIE